MEVVPLNKLGTTELENIWMDTSLKQFLPQLIRCILSF